MQFACNYLFFSLKRSENRPAAVRIVIVLKIEQKLFLQFDGMEVIYLTKYVVISIVLQI